MRPAALRHGEQVGIFVLDAAGTDHRDGALVGAPPGRCVSQAALDGKPVANLAGR